MTKETLMQIFNKHIDPQHTVTSYEHPGCHMINGQIMRDIADDIVEHIKNNTFDSSDLHVRIDYNKPKSSQGNRKLKGIIYMANHPLIDCYLDGLTRKKPSCTGLNGWCYVFSDFFYKSFGKQLSMFTNSLLMYLEPDRAEKEIQKWIDDNKKKFVPDRHGHVAFRTDEAGDITYSLNMWINLANKNPDIQFYAYTKQFDVVNKIPYNINTTLTNFRILLSDSTCDDPNPITKIREDYGSFCVNFKNQDITPDRVKNLIKKYGNKSKCPGAAAGCYGCTKCSEKETETTKNIWAEEH